MKKGTEITGYVERIDYPNKGIIQTTEGPLKVACALPGQKIRCTVKKFRSGSGEGILREIIQRSDIETEPVCPHAARCGGCLYQGVGYEEELKIKEAQVRRLLEPVLAMQSAPYEFEGIVRSPVYGGYRNKMEYTFGDEYKDGPLALGMHRRRSMYDIETVVSCDITDPDYGRIIEATVSFFAGMKIPYYHRVTHIGYLRHLLVRRTRTGEILTGLVTSGQRLNAVDITHDNTCAASDMLQGDNADSMAVINHCIGEDKLLAAYTDMLLDLEHKGIVHGTFRGIVHIINDSIADAVKADRIEMLYGEPYITEELLGLKFKITPFSFFQTNTYGAEVLYSKVMEYVRLSSLPSEGSIYDLYSGTGTIAQIMAGMYEEQDKTPACTSTNESGVDATVTGDKKANKKGITAVGVEIVEEAVKAARENAASNGLNNCRFIAGDVLKVLDDLTDKPDLIILDPPRDGIHPKALPKIISYGVENIIYVSCKPTSLVRDLPEFMAAGYAVTKLCPIDQFPRTGNIETVCLLSKLSSAKHHIEINVDMDELDLTSAEAKATYEEIRNWVQEKYGLHVTNLNIAQVKQKHGIIERENYNKPKSPDSKQPGCPQEKVKAIEDAMRHFQMI